MAPLHTFDGWIIWVGALATLALYSVLYKENPVYRFAEHIFLGIATAYGLYVTWKDILYPMWFTEFFPATPYFPPGVTPPPPDPNEPPKPSFTGGYYLWCIPMLAGAMYYTVFSKRFNWMSRLVMTTLLAFSAGLTFREFFGTYWPQIGKSFKPLVVSRVTEAGQFDLMGSVIGSFTNILFVVCMVSVMTYFLFSFEQRSRLVRNTAHTGRWLMMIAFGAMFGSTVMARMSLFLGRLEFLFRDWIGWIK